MKRIVLFVEGEGDTAAAPVLVRRLLESDGPEGGDLVDPCAFKVGGLGPLTKNGHEKWLRWLKAALKRPNVSAILLLLDGDVGSVKGVDFCPVHEARSLAAAARQAGAGVLFSVAVVFAMREFESWLLAGIASIAGQALADGRTVASDAGAPGGDLEENPRNAKAPLGRFLEGGYSATRDQEQLTRIIDLDAIRTHNLRSFVRLESAIRGLAEAIRNDEPLISPAPAAGAS